MRSEHGAGREREAKEKQNQSKFLETRPLSRYEKKKEEKFLSLPYPCLLNLNDSILLIVIIF